MREIEQYKRKRDGNSSIKTADNIIFLHRELETLDAVIQNQLSEEGYAIEKYDSNGELENKAKKLENNNHLNMILVMHPHMEGRYPDSRSLTRFNEIYMFGKVKTLPPKVIPISSIRSLVKQLKRT